MATPRFGWKSCLCVHAAVFTWYVFTLWRNCSLEITAKHPGAQTYGGRWKYLTFINLVMQTVFFGICVLTDLAHVAVSVKSARGGLPALLSQIGDFYFSVLAFPVATFVFSSFWVLYSYDRELVYPKFIDQIIPTWLNHALHTIILPLILLQMYLQPHKYPSRLKGILSLALFSVVYLAWVLWVHHISGIWVYPIMARLSSTGLTLFLGVAAFSMVPLYLLGEKLYQVMWRAADGGGGKGAQKKKK
ncbi:androgen dependent TFPI regulating protein 1 [Denticeps clupeoides]|uniref:Androgen-dependent TFPI-regulating protein n=1 Tax=Denticeps clupeoides TaxID=299321 RepID=A0AAY4B807_9TELE|nr:androgen-induced gene 1 protein-like [Denticeps clupeoides]